jgi:hypothetical protein
MPTATVLKVKTKARPLGTFRPPARDLDLDALRLQGDRGQVADLKRSISSGELQQTLEGASTLTLKVRDYTRALLNSALLQAEAHLTLDNIEYSLAKVSHDGDELTLIFEETGVNLLRKYNSPRKANRGATTRAQFIRGFVREVKERVIPFNCPEVNERQPVAAAQAAAASAPAGGGGSSYKPAQGGGDLTVKHAKATQHQLDMGKLIVETTRGRGGDHESCAGAIATAIQESNLTNMSGGDRDSQGLYQQRPSMGWGSVAQIRTPAYAIGKFLDQYLAYRRKGEGWLMASHHTQRSAYPSAPAAWYPEGQKFASFFGGSGGGDLSFLAGSPADAGKMTTQVQPYEFSRGTADKKETSWECSGRLADEVQFRRFMRGGALWYVSDEWLIKQPVVYRINEYTPGVVSLRFDFETRVEAADASLQVTTRRYSILPGDVIELTNEGQGSGKWLVKENRRSLFSQVADIALTRKRPKLPEPAPQTTSVSVGGSTQSISGGTAVDGPQQAVAAYHAAEQISGWNTTYSQPQRNDQRPGGHMDCSSGVSKVLEMAGIPLPSPMKPNAPTTFNFPNWGEPGAGKFFTVMLNVTTHIWIRWNGIGPAWRFDTGGGSGGKNWNTPRSTSGFVERHWPGL